MRSVLVKLGMCIFAVVIVYDLLDLISYLVTGFGIYAQAFGGSQSPLVIVIAEQLGGVSPEMFWAVAAVSFTVLVFLVSALLMYVFPNRSGGK